MSNGRKREMGDNGHKAFSTAQQTEEFIKAHPHIKHCLRRGLINYSSLARFIAQELHLEKKTSLEAILVAARRFQERLKKEAWQEKKIKELLAQSQVELKSKMAVFVLKKSTPFELLEKIQQSIRQEQGMVYLIEGAATFTLITSENYGTLIKAKLGALMLRSRQDLVLILLKSPQGIEETTGVVAFLTASFAEQGINIREFLSCWTDTILLIDAKDMEKAFQLLRF